MVYGFNCVDLDVLEAEKISMIGSPRTAFEEIKYRLHNHRISSRDSRSTSKSSNASFAI
jgi:hypothetical protein